MYYTHNGTTPGPSNPDALKINGTATIFVYDGWKVIEELDGSGSRVAWNIYGAGADEILYRNQRGTALLYHTDKEGNVMFLLDAAGNGIERYTYDAFGAAKIMDWSGNLRGGSAYGNRYMFNGKDYVAEMGLYDYRHRWYQPQLGRFLQVDPKGFDAGDENLFRYCADDPINKTDPMGLFSSSMPLQSYSGLSAADRMDLINLAGETSLQGNAAAAALSAYNNSLSGGSGGMNSGTNHFVGQIDAVPSGNSQSSSASSYRYEELPRRDSDNHGTARDFRYQLIDPQGNPAKGGECTNRETLISSKSDGVIETKTSHSYNSVKLSSKGILTDHVAVPIVVGAHVNRHIVQRFSNELFRYNGAKWGNVSTIFEHEFWIRNSQVTSIEARIVVP